jgi:hypothetical protein
MSETTPEPEQEVVVAPQNTVYDSGAVIPTLADLSYAKNSEPPVGA